jgi:hypothetical protein
MSKTTKTMPVVSRPLQEEELSPDLKLLKRVATNAVREACEVRRGRLTPRAILAYQWLTEPGTSQTTWTLAWVCLELGWNYENWRKKSLDYVHRNWKQLAWRGFMGDLEARSRQVRALATGGGSDYLPLVELSYWNEIANVDLPDAKRSPTRFEQELPLEFEEERQ